MRFSQALRAAVGAAAFSLAVSSACLADDDDDGPARDLVCNGCVGTGDIAAEAVTDEKIAPGAVGFGKLDPTVVDAIEEGADLGPITVTVDCRAGDSLQDAVDAARPGQMTTIVVTEGCREDVVIKKNDIILDGDPLGTGDPITRGNIGTVTLEGAQRISVQNLTFRGQGVGLRALRGSTFLLKNAIVVGKQPYGVGVFEGSHAVIEDCRIESNGDLDSEIAAGIIVDGGSSAGITSNQIGINAGDGIRVSNGSFAQIEDNTIEFNAGRGVFTEANLTISSATAESNGNRIRMDGNIGVLVEDGGVYKAGVELSRALPDNPLGFEEISAGPRGVAMIVKDDSSADLRQVKLTGDIFVTTLSLLEVRGDVEEPNISFSTIDGNVRALLKSLTIVGNPVDFNGSCSEDASSICN